MFLMPAAASCSAVMVDMANSFSAHLRWRKAGEQQLSIRLVYFKKRDAMLNLTLFNDTFIIDTLQHGVKTAPLASNIADRSKS